MNAAIMQTIEELERQRTALDAAIAALRALNGNGGNGSGTAPVRRIKDPEKHRAAQKMWENGIPVTEIADKVGVHESAVYLWRKNEGWQR